MDTEMKRRRSGGAEDGVTLIELMIAIIVLGVGLLGIAQLFVVATMGNAFSVNTSEALVDAQRCLEGYRSIAIQAGGLGVADPRLVSGTVTGTGETANSPAFEEATGGFNSEKYFENVWVFDWNGDLVVGTGARNYTVSPSAPPDYDGRLAAPTAASLLVIVRLEPVYADNRYNQPITLASIISQD